MRSMLNRRNNTSKIMQALFIFAALTLFLISPSTAANNHKLNQLAQVDSIIEKGRVLQADESYDLAMQHFEKSLELSEMHDFELGVAKSKYSIGSLHRLKGKNPIANEFFQQALKLFYKLGDSLEIADTYNALGIIHTNMAEYPAAMNYLIKSVEISRRHDARLIEAKALMNLGGLYVMLNEIDKAIDVTYKALNLRRKLNDKGGIARTMNNLGVYYARKGELDKALNLYQEALSIERSLNDKPGIANNLTNIGNLHFRIGKPDLAVQFLKEALSIREALGDKQAIAQGLYNIGFIYSVQGNPEALNYLQKSVDISLNTQNNNLRLRGYETISEHYEGAGDYKNALLYRLKFYQLNDSIFSEKNKNELIEIQTRFETARKEKELLVTRRVSLALGGLLLLALAFVITIFLVYKKNKRNNLKVTKQNIEIIRQKKRLEEAKNQLQKNLKIKELFFAAANHELRLPLNIISGYAALLSSKITDEKQLNFVQNIQSSSKNMKKLVDDILDFSTMETGVFRLEKEPVNILNLTKEIEHIFETELSGSPIRLIVKHDKSIDKWLMIDGVRVRQILYNLIENSIKFTVVGEINVNFQIFHNNEFNNYTLSIIVTDTGIGIPEKLRQLIFNTNYSTKPVSDLFRSGFGLGLQIVQKIVECMCGTINLTSSEGSGTKINILIPHLESADMKVESKLNNFPAIDKINIGSNLLVVDDSELNRRLLRIMLEENFTNIEEAEDGIEAIQIASEKNPEIILMDIYMPNMDGFKTLKKLRKSEKTRQIPVIAVTASASEDERLKVMAAGFDAYFTKPVQKNQLLSEIQKLIEKSKSINP